MGGSASLKSLIPNYANKNAMQPIATKYSGNANFGKHTICYEYLYRLQKLLSTARSLQYFSEFSIDRWKSICYKKYADSYTLAITNIIEPPEEHPPGATTISAKKKSNCIPFSWARNYGLICKNQKSKGQHMISNVRYTV